ALRGPRQREWVFAVRADLDNFRTAIGWALDRREAEMAQALTGGLAWFWWTQGGVAEGLGRIEAAIALPGTVEPGIRATALARAAFLALMAGDATTSARHRDEAVAALRNVDALTRASCDMLLADLADGLGAHDEALARYEDAAEALAGQDEPWAGAMTLCA